jgi:hypothetical protein
MRTQRERGINRENVLSEKLCIQVHNTAWEKRTVKINGIFFRKE